MINIDYNCSYCFCHGTSCDIKKCSGLIDDFVIINNEWSYSSRFVCSFLWSTDDLVGSFSALYLFIRFTASSFVYIYLYMCFFLRPHFTILSMQLSTKEKKRIMLHDHVHHSTCVSFAVGFVIIKSQWYKKDVVTNMFHKQISR